MVLVFPGLVSGFETMKEREEEDRRMGFEVRGLATRTGLGLCAAQVEHGTLYLTAINRNYIT